MAYVVTSRAKELFSGVEKTPNIFCIIDGYQYKFSAEVALTIAKFGRNAIKFGQSGLIFGGLISLDDQKNLISLTGSTTEISQQLEPDQGNVNSVQKMTIRLVDLNEEATRLISPSIVFDDILYKFTQVFLGPSKGSFPEDYIEMFNGNIQGVKAGAGYVDIEIAHPEDVRRAKIFTKVEQITTQGVNYKSLNIQGIFIQAYKDIAGAVRVQFISGASGDNATVAVAGQDISVQIDVAQTKISTIKKQIENSPDAAQIVKVTYVKDANKNLIAELTGSYLQLQSDSDIYVDDVKLFLPKVENKFLTYIKINEEIIEYTGIDVINSRLTGCIRGRLNTFGQSHDSGTNVSSFYKLGDATQENGNALDLALNLLLSGAEKYYEKKIDVLAIAQYGFNSSIPNAIYFTNVDLERDYGVTEGDFLDIYNTTLNTHSNLEILSVEKRNGYSFLLVNQGLNIEESGASVRLRSRFNVLPDGLGLRPIQVDILRFLEIKKLYFSSIALYEFYLKETIQASEFLSRQVYLPSCIYSIPRRGRIGIGFTAPPLFQTLTKTLDVGNVVKANTLVLNRSTTKNFYNAIVYKFDQDSLSDKYLRGRIEVSSSSINRIKIPNQPLTIESRGLRNSQNIALFLRRNSVRFLNRYQYGAESLDVQVPFQTGWDVEVGDPIILGGDDLQLSDIKRGTRKFEPRVFEITNKRFNWKLGQATLTLTDSSFDLKTRFGVFSPSSYIVSGNVNSIIIKDSFGTRFPNIEKEKWSFYINRQIKIVSPDYSHSEVTTLLGFNPSNDYEMLINPITTPAQEGWIVRLPNYEQITENQSSVYKQIHLFWTPQVTITNVITSLSIEVDDISKFFVGSIVRMHSDDYSFDTGDNHLEVKQIIGNTIILDKGIDNLMIGYKVDLIGFVSDNGPAYAWV